MGVVIETCTKYPGGRTRITVTDIAAMHKFMAVSLLKRSRNGPGSRSCLKNPLGLLLLGYHKSAFSPGLAILYFASADRKLLSINARILPTLPGSHFCLGFAPASPQLAGGLGRPFPRPGGLASLSALLMRILDVDTRDTIVN